MTRTVRLSLGNSPYIGQLTKGCRTCIRGAKLVLFITGRCEKTCYYCPISAERKNRDITFANEVSVNQVDDALTEARLMDARGMSITGGEPLLDMDRTLKYIQAFKREFGNEFHIHLYTGLNPVPLRSVQKLLEAGLDELRLHRFEPSSDLVELRRLTTGKARLGVEIPVIPSQFEKITKFLRQLEEIEIDFVNINEMEYSLMNQEEMRQRELTVRPNTIASVKGSEETALALVEWAQEHTSLNIHYCPISLKDGAQLRNRFRRRAKNIAKPFERINQEGLLIKGILIPPTGMLLAEAFKVLIKEFQIPSKQLWLNEEKNRLETSTSVARKLAKRLKIKGFQVGIAEEYPIDSRFQVAYTPL